VGAWAIPPFGVWSTAEGIYLMGLWVPHVSSETEFLLNVKPVIFYSLCLHPVAREITYNRFYRQSQPLFFNVNITSYYTLHVSAYMQAIIRCCKHKITRDGIVTL
jgi:hypothetical protein